MKEIQVEKFGRWWLARRPGGMKAFGATRATAMTALRQLERVEQNAKYARSTTLNHYAECDRFGQKLRLYRRRVGLSRGELAQAIGASRMTVFRWERGEVFPRPRFLKALADALSLENVDALLK